MVYYIYREKSGYWRWRLIDAKGMTIVDSGEHYDEEQHCAAAVELIKTSSLAPVCVLKKHSRGPQGDAIESPPPTAKEVLGADAAVGLAYVVH